MTKYIIHRLIQTVIVVMIVSFLSFMILQIIPGDPVLTMLGTEATEETITALRKELWLDRPVIVQYGHWLVNLLQGDMGKSVMYREDVAELIAKRLPITLHLTLSALVISVLLGVTGGVISAVTRGTAFDQVITVAANAGVAIPRFWLGIMGIYLFGLTLRWLPIQGYTRPFDDFWLSTKQVIMPAFCLSVFLLGALTRQTRSSMLEVIRQDYIRTARSKGLRERVVITRHTLKNALIPIVTLLGLGVRGVVGGSVLIETVFNVPGVGRMLVEAVFDKDFIIVQAMLLIIALVVSLANLLVDISYSWLDPRIHY
jgi:peptide/nickel transport system permease protein